MERFAKRKVIILPTRAGNKHAWFKEDSGEKYYIGQFNGALTDEAIISNIKGKWSKLEPAFIADQWRLVEKAGDEW